MIERDVVIFLRKVVKFNIKRMESDEIFNLDLLFEELYDATGKLKFMENEKRKGEIIRRVMQLFSRYIEVKIHLINQYSIPKQKSEFEKLINSEKKKLEKKGILTKN